MKKLISVLFLLVLLCTTNFADADTSQVFKMGSDGEQVAIIQEVLASEGYYNGVIDGVFGKATHQSVLLYQEEHELIVDGIVGENTLNHLFNGVAHSHLETIENYVIPDLKEETVVSRGLARDAVPAGAYLDWWKDIRNKLLFPEDEILIKDFETGVEFKVIAIAGTNHMDVEALSYDDAQIIQNLWGGYSWERRPVIAYLDGQAVAASLNGMPHAGRDDKPYTDYVSNRSGGFGYGYNYDKVKGNDFEGVICLHFKNSLLHKNSARDGKHQAAVKKAAGIE